MVDENPTNNAVPVEGAAVASNSAPSPAPAEPTTAAPEVAAQPKEIEMTELHVNKNVDVGRVRTAAHG